MTVSLDSKTKVPWEQKLRLVNQQETKTYECFNTKKMEKGRITFEDWKGLFLSKILKLSSNNFELSIYPHEGKKNSFFKKLTSKNFELVGYIKDYNFWRVLKNKKVKQ